MIENRRLGAFVFSRQSLRARLAYSFAMTVPAPILVDLFPLLDLPGIRRGRIHREDAKRAYESPDDFHAFFCPRICFGQIPYRPAAMIPLGSTASLSVS